MLEMTTGSVSASEAQRKALALGTRWWNSTGGGTTSRMLGAEQKAQSSNSRGFGAIKGGDGGKRFKEQWPEVDEENWQWMEDCKIDPQTGKSSAPVVQQQSSEPETSAVRKRANGDGAGLGAVVDGAQAVRDVEQGWVRKHWGKLALAGLFVYVLTARVLSDVKG